VKVTVAKETLNPSANKILPFSSYLTFRLYALTAFAHSQMLCLVFLYSSYSHPFRL